eukprot:13715103-Alexandrium_andersonii.AAC.2
MGTSIRGKNGPMGPLPCTVWCARCHKGAHAFRDLRHQTCGAAQVGASLREARAANWQRGESAWSMAARRRRQWGCVAGCL